MKTRLITLFALVIMALAACQVADDVYLRNNLSEAVTVHAISYTDRMIDGNIQPGDTLFLQKCWSRYSGPIMWDPDALKYYFPTLDVTGQSTAFSMTVDDFTGLDIENLENGTVHITINAP